MRLPCCRTRIEDEAEDARPLRQDVTSDEQPGVSPASPAWAKRDTALNHSALFRVKERVQCFFEGGRACRKEDPKAHKGANAVRGVHSDWVGKSIIAAARPQQPIVEREGTLEDMLAKNVKGIVNLQEIGEHAHCGSGILDHTGFSYDPDYFMQAGISVYNFPSVDMKSPAMESTLNTVQVIDSHVKRGEVVLVHCHAGLGRTGTAIASYFIYADGMRPFDAIELVRRHRPKSVETPSQVQLVNRFANFLARQPKPLPLAHIQRQLDKSVGAGRPMGKGEDAIHAEKISSRIRALERVYEGAWKGEFRRECHQDFESTLGGQEMLLHGTDRSRHHPMVPWRLAKALWRIRRSRGEAGHMAEEAARILSTLSSGEARFVDLKVLDIELDLHCSDWRSCEGVSLSQALQLLEAWLSSVRPDKFDLDAIEKLLSETLSSERESRRALLRRFDRQHALTIHSLAAVAAFLVGTEGEDGSPGTAGTGEEPRRVILGWLVGRLLFACDKDQDAVVDISTSGESAKLGELLLKLSAHMHGHFSEEEGDQGVVHAS